MRKMDNKEIAPLLEKMIDDWLNVNVNWFYKNQITPYVQPLIAYLLSELARHGIHFTSDK